MHRCAALTVRVFFYTLQLRPLTNWFLCSFLSKWRHHTQNIMLFSWSCLSHMRPSTQSLLNRLLLESSAAGSLLFDTSRISLSNGVTAEEVAAEHLMNQNCSRFVFLSAESSLCVAMFTRRPSAPPPLQAVITLSHIRDTNWRLSHFVTYMHIMPLCTIS